MSKVKHGERDQARITYIHIEALTRKPALGHRASTSKRVGARTLFELMKYDVNNSFYGTFYAHARSGRDVKAKM